MVFWILVAGLVAGVTLAITRPLMRQTDAQAGASAPADADVAVYKDQLNEVVADEARGALAADEAEAARTEIARRLLRTTASAQKPDSDAEQRHSRFVRPVTLITSIVLPVASLALYLAYGAPGMPGQPLSERLAESRGSERPNDLVAKVEERLREHPEDGAGWDVIAPVYYAMGRYTDAAGAYLNAARLLGESAQRLQGFANARIHVENGIVQEDARRALERVLVIAPNLKEPRIWLALAKEQDGRLTEAAADYRQLIADAPANAPWRKVLEDRLAALASESGGKIASIGPAAEAGPAKGPVIDPSAAPQTSPDAASVMAMSPAERQAFIGQMVEGLATRLKADGSDSAGWLRLIRAYEVLGRRDDAIKALGDARTKLKEDQVGLARVEDLARQLGLGS